MNINERVPFTHQFGRFYEDKEAYTLNNGQKAIYFEHQLFNFFVFESGNWQYMLGIDKRVSKVTPATFVEIANSIE
ncbi:hypothetical protein MHH33_10955 [Paenisporosarcina sp. FSL H8-0542]|uniref:hypothetical protein n=1 Tax=Paenisporosarcina sp. FSL H8-0542 TaxID=2921401 RepID=UPI00315A3AF5